MTWVYPRVGGGALIQLVDGVLGQGLSPRGRGSRPDASFVESLSRSIPAWAGEPMFCTWVMSGGEVYPRVGGGAGS